LPADPSAHVHVAVRRAWAGGIHVEADAGPAFLAVAAAPARNVEGHRDDVADLDELDVSPGLDDFAGDLMTEDKTFRRGGSAADHVLVAAADVGRHGLQDPPVVALGAVPRELGVIDTLNLNCSRTNVRNSAVGCHQEPP